MFDGATEEIIFKRLEAEREKRRRENQLARYAPMDPQLKFHLAGFDHNERLFMAANQVGKTYAGGSEAAMHATGFYPSWWTGRIFDHPTVGWVGGVTAEATRDGAQRILLGRTGQLGTGTIPAKCLVGKPVSRQGVADAYAIVRVRHVNGGISTIIFKSYDQGREKWQGDTIDWLWFDEEPPEDIYFEGKTRTNAGDNFKGGIVFVTFTPLLGMSTVVKRFLLEVNDSRHVTSMTLEEAEFYSEDRKKEITDGYPEHEREARTKGIPTLGSGRIFPIAEDRITYAPFPFPKFWRKIVGLDFGWDHPTAAVWAAHDPDSDCVYIYDCYRLKRATPIIHGAAIRSRGAKIPVAWPHDGLQHDKGSGEQLAQLYRQQGVAMLPERAQFADDRGHSPEAANIDILDRMETGRWKVAAHLADWWEEFRLYHRKDGVIVKLGDDLMSASHKIVMSLRFAKADEAHPSDRYRANGRSGGTGAWAA